MTDYPSPRTTIEVFGTEVEVYASGLDDLTFVCDSMTINRIEIEFRAFFKRGTAGIWIGQNIFAYRTADGEHRYQQRSATPGQTSKLYSVLREACESMSATLLLDGQDAALGREIERMEVEIESRKLDLADLVTKQKTLRTQYETSVLNK
jgi:hypothetical protein